MKDIQIIIRGIVDGGKYTSKQRQAIADAIQLKFEMAKPELEVHACSRCNSKWTAKPFSEKFNIEIVGAVLIGGPR